MAENPTIDGWMMLVWLGVNALLGVAAWRLSKALSPRGETLELAFHTLVACLAGIILAATLLGAFGLLRGPMLIATVAAEAGTLLVGLQSRVAWPGARQACPLSGFKDGTVPARPPWPWVMLWAVMLAFLLGHVTVSGLLTFPRDWDTLVYHLPVVDHWLQEGSLYAPRLRDWYVPGNHELVGLWIVGHLSGDYLIALTNLPAVVLLALATVEAGRNLGLSPGWRHAAALAVVSHSIVMKQILDVENDVAAAAWFLTCLAYALRYARQPRPAELAFAGISLGLLAGVKFYALGYAAVAWATLWVLVALTRGPREATRAVAAALPPALLAGGYWYLRNFLVTGHLFALTELAPEEYRPRQHAQLWASTFFGNGRPEVLPLGQRALWIMTGPVHFLAVCCLPASLVWLTITGLRPGHPEDVGQCRRLWPGMAFAVLAAGLVLGVTPYALENDPGTLNQLEWGFAPVRYGLCFLSVTVVAFTGALQELAGPPLASASEAGPVSPPGWRGAALGLQGAIAFGAAFQLAVPYHEVECRFWDCVRVALPVLTAAGLLWAFWPAGRAQRKVVLTGLGCFLTLGAVWGADRLGTRWHQGFTAYYDALFGGDVFAYLAQTTPAGTRLCVLDHRSYPFLGSSREYKVCHPMPAQVRSDARLLRYLQRHRADLLLTPSERALPRPDPLGESSYQWARQWASAKPFHFTPVAELKRYTLFVVYLPPGAAGRSLTPSRERR